MTDAPEQVRISSNLTLFHQWFSQPLVIILEFGVVLWFCWGALQLPFPFWLVAILLLVAICYVAVEDAYHRMRCIFRAKQVFVCRKGIRVIGALSDDYVPYARIVEVNDRMLFRCSEIVFDQDLPCGSSVAFFWPWLIETNPAGATVLNDLRRRIAAAREELAVNEALTAQSRIPAEQSDQ